MLEIDSLTKRYPGAGGTLALADFSLTLESGVLGLLGPNGAGKTTLMSILATVTRPTSGSFRWNGHDGVREPLAVRRALGYLPQDFGVYDRLTAREFLAYLGRLKGIAGRDLARRVDAALELVNLHGAARRRLGTFSGGMRQRVGIARVLIMQPQILLMDEPFGALDAQTRSLMQELLLEVWERHHQTVLFITHDIEEALLLADRVYVMTARPGRIKKTIVVDIPRPRAMEVTTSPEFNQLRREVLALIREESQRAAVERERVR
jgi:NitT/TauT family transport system ATP-binding protein